MGLESNQGALFLTSGSAPRNPTGAAVSGRLWAKAALTRQSSKGSIAQQTPHSQRPPPRLAKDFGKLGKATFPRKSGAWKKGNQLRKEGKRKRPGKEKVLAGWTPQLGRLSGATRWRREKHKNPEASGGRPVRRDLRVLYLPPRIWIPETPPAGSPTSRTSCRRAGSVEGRRRAGRCRARLCILVGPQPGSIVRISSACGSVREAGQAYSPRARVGKTSRTHQVQSPGTHRAGSGAHKELWCNGGSYREPRRTRSAGLSPKRPSLLKKGHQVQSRKKLPLHFI